jgi:hypothetical protein
MKVEDDDLSKLIVDVFADHLALAFDNYYRAMSADPADVCSGVRARLASISSAIHSYACLEALV